MLAGPDKDLFNQFDRQRVGFLFCGAYSRLSERSTSGRGRRASQRKRYETVRIQSIRTGPYWIGRIHSLTVAICLPTAASNRVVPSLTRPSR